MSLVYLEQKNKMESSFDDLLAVVALFTYSVKFIMRNVGAITFSIHPSFPQIHTVCSADLTSNPQKCLKQ